ncbi:hypothetical protein MRB53_030593 [Persea americana]|uniref:Uncharacterized protein n=1 Tax=Persea americana TaxID=3435 RepID=A0ACC2KM80_PERAE|nr:hypothetical protein MRB53_030593 [Persea americana]
MSMKQNWKQNNPKRMVQCYLNQALDDEIPELVKVALSMDRPKNERCSPGIVGPPVKLLLILHDTFHLSTLHLSYQEEVMIGVDVPKAILDIEDSFHRLNKVVGTHVAV